MKKFLILFISIPFILGCYSEPPSFNNKNLAGKYHLEIPSRNDTTKFEGMEAFFMGMFLCMKVTFYENGEGIIDAGELSSVFGNVNEKFTYSISQDSILNFRDSNDSLEQCILRKVDESYDRIQLIHPETKELELTFVRE